VPVIVLTGHGSIDLAVRAVKEGAEHFLTKPVEMPVLLLILERAIADRRMRLRQLAGRSVDRRRVIDPFLGSSSAILRLADQAARVAATDSTVLIQGETGSGKGVLAGWIHRNSPRREESFVDLNCAGLARELVESELFGHEKGAFTGATVTRAGLLEVAHLGTVFLDEIGDLDLQVQPKLLKAIEDKRFRRLGSVRDQRVDVRLLAASHQNLESLVEEKKFRSDLFFRISTIPLLVPPLRERREDIPLLAATLLRGIAADLGIQGAELTSDAMKAVKEHSWPGNVRELRNVLERGLLLSGRHILDRGDLLFGGSAKNDSASGMTLEEVERRHIAAALGEENGHVGRTAKRLGVPRSSLYERAKRLGILPGRA
jgi:DNA-binding NtrC family response regulator